MPRLHRLAEFYNVPVDQLLPPIDGRPDAEVGGTDEPSGWTTGDKVIIDLVALGAASGPQVDLIRRYLEILQVQPPDFNRRILNIRTQPFPAVAALV